MLPRITAPLLAAVGLAFFACGPRTPTPVATARPRAAAGKGVLSKVLVDTASGSVRFAIALSNDSPKRVELDFPTGLTHDFAVLDSTGKEVWRWSQGRMYTQGMQNRLLDADDSVTYAERWSHPAPGRYTLVAQLNSANYPVRQQVQFTLP
ncbi:MAG TPA: BsuPI-related putative proteinase inhibitor [Gemmatimonas sp.]|nr:BsuPI-related putative proteinase inhibitor [Gemmatimonas sp.]